MQRLKKSTLAGLLTMILTLLLLTAGGARAAALTCGSWRVVKSPNARSQNNFLYSVAALSATDVWAVGDYEELGIGNIFRTLTERWNGTTWSVVPSPNVGTGDDHLYGVAAVSSTDIWAVGISNAHPTSASKTLVEQWNGMNWRVVPSPSPGQLSSLSAVTVVSASDVWAVGAYFNSGGIQQTLVEHWNGARWSVVSSPNVGASYNSLNNVTVISATNIWAVGASSSDGGLTFQTLVEQWNGASWTVVPSPNASPVTNDLQGVTGVNPTNIWAVGEMQGVNFVVRTLIEHWNGTRWQVVSSPNVGSGENDLFNVAAISPTDIWAVGYDTDHNSGFYRTLTEHWNGTAWSIVKSPNPGRQFNQLYAVTAVSTTLWTVGSAATGSQNNTLIEFFC